MHPALCEGGAIQFVLFGFFREVAANCAFARVDQVGKRHPDQLFTGIADNFCAGPVGVGNPAIQVAGNDTGRCIFKGQMQLFLTQPKCFLGAFAR